MMGRLVERASSNASSPHGNQSTGLCWCCSRYGLVSLASRFVCNFYCPLGERYEASTGTHRGPATTIWAAGCWRAPATKCDRELMRILSVGCERTRQHHQCVIPRLSKGALLGGVRHSELDWLCSNPPSLPGRELEDGSIILRIQLGGWLEKTLTLAHSKSGSGDLYRASSTQHLPANRVER